METIQEYLNKYGIKKYELVSDIAIDDHKKLKFVFQEYHCEAVLFRNMTTEQLNKSIKDAIIQAVDSELNFITLKNAAIKDLIYTLDRFNKPQNEETKKNTTNHETAIISTNDPSLRCNKCGRLSYSAKPNEICGLPQPNGNNCTGKFIDVNGGAYTHTFEFISTKP